MCTMMLAAMDVSIVSTAVPQIVGDLGGFALFSWVFSAYLLAQTVTIPVYGKLADQFGRKSVLMIGMVVFLIGSTASALAWNMPVLIACRGLQGIGAGAIMAIVNTLAGDLYSVRERAAIQGWLSSVWGISAILGPLLGGAFAEYVSWRWIFLINLPIGAVAMTLLAVFLHESVERRRHRIDYAGALLVLGVASALIFALMEGGQTFPWLSLPILGALAAGVLMTGALVIVERRASEPVMPGWLWRRRVLAGANLATIGMGAVMMAPDAYLPTFAQSVLGLGAIPAGLVLASMSLGWPTASSFSGRIYLRIGFRQTALIGAALIMIATFAFGVLPAVPPVWTIVADTVVLGAGFGLLSTPLLVGVQSVVDWDRRGVVTGANMFSRNLGASIGATMMGALFNAALRGRLADAPRTMKALVPDNINRVIGALQEGRLPQRVQDYLRDGIGHGTVHLYTAGLVIAVGILVAVVVIPRRFHIGVPD